MAGNQGFDAGSIFVALKANVEGFTSGLKTALSSLGGFAKDLQGFSTRIASIGKSIGNAMLAPVRAVGSLISSLTSLKAIFVAFIAGKTFDELVTGPARAAVELERMAARAGIATDQLEKLQFVVSAAGGRGDDVSIGLEKLNRILEDTRRGSQDFIPVLQELGFLGLSIDQIVDKVLTNPNLGAAGLKKLGISELAVISKLSRQEIDKLLVSFVKLGNGTDAELFSLGNRLQVVKTQLTEAFHNVAEQVSKLVLPPLLEALEAVEKFIEAHFPEIVAFFDTVGQQAAAFFESVKKTAQVPEELAFALQQAVEAIFEAIGNIVLESFTGFVKIGIESFKALGAGVIILFGPLFDQLWAAAKIQLDFLLEKAQLTVEGFFNGIFRGLEVLWRNAVDVLLSVLAHAVHEVVRSLKDLPDAIVPDGLVGSLQDVVDSLNIARIANNNGVIEQAKKTVEAIAEEQRQEESAAQWRTQKLQEFADQFQGTNEAQTKNALDVFVAACKEIALQTNRTIKDITGEVLGAVDAVSTAFGFKLGDVGKQFDKNLAAQRAAQKAALDPSLLEGPRLPPDFNANNDQPNSASGFTDSDIKAIEADRARAKQDLEQSLAASEQSISRVTGSLLDGIHTGLNALFVEGKSTLEALGDVGAKVFDQFVGTSFDKLQSGFSKALASAFNDPAVGSAIGDLAGALIGIAGGVLSILSKKKSSSKTFSNVADIVNSSQQVRGVVAGPESVAIAAVGQDLQRALAPTNDILRAQLRALFDIRGAMGGGGAGGFPFAGTVETT